MKSNWMKKLLSVMIIGTAVFGLAACSGGTDTEEPAETCATCGAPLPGKQKGQKYCSRFCYLLAMDQTHVEGTCQWCGRPITTTAGVERTYCSRECAAAGRYALSRI